MGVRGRQISSPGKSAMQGVINGRSTNHGPVTRSTRINRAVGSSDWCQRATGQATALWVLTSISDSMAESGNRSCCWSRVQKRVIFKGYQHHQLKTKFGPVFFTLLRLKCQPCGRLFQLNSGCLAGLKALAEANISPGLRQVAIDCAAAWPYWLAQ